MQLRNARLCLDCEEIHIEQQCPVCASETSAFVARWIPASERRQARRPRPAAAPSDSKPQSQSPLRWLKRGAAGFALVAVGRWLLRDARPVEWSEPGAAPRDKRRRHL